MAKPSARDAISRRLLARGDPGLRRRSTPDGGEVVSGPIATRALKALGARAMTMDRTIFVAEDFDLSRPEDQSLYAHELHHQQESGGSDGGGQHDSEEFAAQAIEQMVLHRSAQGEALTSILRDVAANGAHATAATPSPTNEAGGAQTTEDQAMAAYQSMRNNGFTHEAIVRRLAQYVMEALLNAEEQQDYQSAGKSRFL